MVVWVVGVVCRGLDQWSCLCLSGGKRKEADTCEVAMFLVCEKTKYMLQHFKVPGPKKFEHSSQCFTRQTEQSSGLLWFPGIWVHAVQHRAAQPVPKFWTPRTRCLAVPRRTARILEALTTSQKPWQWIKEVQLRVLWVTLLGFEVSATRSHTVSHNCFKVCVSRIKTLSHNCVLRFITGSCSGFAGFQPTDKFSIMRSHCSSKVRR